MMYLYVKYMDVGHDDQSADENRCIDNSRKLREFSN